MADRSSTASMFVFLVSLLGVFAIIVNGIPAGFLTPQNLTETTLRSEWLHNIDVGYLNYTDSGNLTKGTPHGETVHLSMGDVTVNVEWWNVGQLVGVYFYHTWKLDPWGIFWEFQEFDDMPVTLSDMIAHQTADFANRSYMILTCPCQKSYHTYFVYNSTTYASWTEAYAGGELELYVGMGWNDAVEMQNAWSLIWSILTFNAPQVFGTGIEAGLLNALIAIPLWASFAVTGAIMILWFIPLLGGE